MQTSTRLRETFVLFWCDHTCILVTNGHNNSFRVNVRVKTYRAILGNVSSGWLTLSLCARKATIHSARLIVQSLFTHPFTCHDCIGWFLLFSRKCLSSSISYSLPVVMIGFSFLSSLATSLNNPLFGWMWPLGKAGLRGHGLLGIPNHF